MATIASVLKNVKRGDIITRRIYQAITLINKGFDPEEDINDILEESSTNDIDDVESSDDFFAC